MRCLSILALLLLANSSFAMLMKKKEPDPSTEVCYYDNRWTGVTVGLNAGALINASDGQVKPIGDFKLPAFAGNNHLRTDAFNMHGAAFITGVQVGYNYQIKVLVFGAETDFNYCTLNRKHEVTRNLAAPLVGTMHDKVTQLFNWFGTVRGRVGYAIKQAPVLIYGTGGFAYGHSSSKTEVNFSSAGDRYQGSSSKWRIGWTLGAGVDWGITRHWLMRVEYLYFQLREQHYKDPNVPPPSFPTFLYHSELDTQGHIIRVGFNYKI